MPIIIETTAKYICYPVRFPALSLIVFRLIYTPPEHPMYLRCTSDENGDDDRGLELPLATLCSPPQPPNPHPPPYSPRHIARIVVSHIIVMTLNPTDRRR